MWRLRGKVVWSIVGILCYIFIYYFVEALLRWSVGIAERLPGLFLVFYAAARLPPTLAVSGKYGEAEQASGWTCQLVPPCPAPRHASKPTICAKALWDSPQSHRSAWKFYSTPVPNTATVWVWPQDCLDTDLINPANEKMYKLSPLCSSHLQGSGDGSVLHMQNMECVYCRREFFSFGSGAGDNAPPRARYCQSPLQ